MTCIQEDTWNSGGCFESNLHFSNPVSQKQGLKPHHKPDDLVGEMLPNSPRLYVYHGFCCRLLACFLPFFFFSCQQTQTSSHPLRGWSISTDFTLETLFCRTAVCNSGTIPTRCERTPCLFLFSSVITQSVGLLFSQVFCHVSYSSSLISQHSLLADNVEAQVPFMEWDSCPLCL